MSFKLTSDYVNHLFDEAATGNLAPFFGALDPEVKWRIGSDVKDDVALTGVFVRRKGVSSTIDSIRTFSFFFYHEETGE